MERTIRIKSFYPYTREQLWRAITDAHLLGKWFMENDFQPIIGQEFTFRIAPQKGWDGITHCTVTELVIPATVAYTYCGKAGGEKPLACAGINSDIADKAAKGIFAELDTHLKFTITPVSGGCEVSLVHSGFRGLKMVMVSLIMGMGWKKQLNKKLPVLLQNIYPIS